MQETFIRRQTEWKVTGVHQIFDGFLTLIREKMYFFGVEIND